MQKNKHYFKGPLWAYGLPAIALAAFILFTACPQEGDDDDTPPVAPTLLKVINNLVIPETSNAEDPAPYLEFVFDVDVSGPAVSVTINDATDPDDDANWTAALKEEGDVVDATTVKVTYTAPTENGATPVAAGDELAITLTASGKVYDVVTLRAVGQLFARTTLNATDGYTISEYDALSATVGLASVADGGTETVVWVALDLEDDADVIKTFEAIIRPNSKSETAKTVETGKTAITFTEEISEAAIKLFSVKFATGDDGNPADTVEIKGTTLPSAAGATPTNLIVIDIGLPGEDADNSELPTFYIPYRELGNSTLANDKDYSHVRFRVNKDVTLVLESDLTSTDPTATGYFKGGAVEVLAGGYLRDGAFQGFPLGSGAVLLNRYGSTLGIGPEADKVPNGYEDTYNKYFKGWLLGPASDSPKIEWDATGNSAGSYLEVRPSLIATDAKLTLKKSLGLIYSVWFVGDAALTIDTTSEGEDGPYGDSFHGLLVSSGNRKFYGNEATTITVKPGNQLEEFYLNDDETYTSADPGSGDGWITPEGDDDTDLVITNLGAGSDNSVTATPYVDASTGISGYLNWDYDQE
jgi:hypothetical protein